MEELNALMLIIVFLISSDCYNCTLVSGISSLLIFSKFVFKFDVDSVSENYSISIKIKTETMPKK